jgi:hypothetical protein
MYLFVTIGENHGDDFVIIEMSCCCRWRDEENINDDDDVAIATTWIIDLFWQHKVLKCCK